MPDEKAPEGAVSFPLSRMRERAVGVCGKHPLPPPAPSPARGEGRSEDLLVQARVRAQFVGLVGLLPRESHGRLLVAGAVHVRDLLRLAAEMAVGGGRLV